MGPRFSNMLNAMDPSRIAASAVELNLGLMKWRLDPNLDLDRIKDCRCLLIGAGTLGCNVARCLLGWGVRKISFVDSGRVSFSNPVRQSLFTFSDCLSEGKKKAEAAADALKKIFPRVDSKGILLSIPMPGHSIAPNQCQQISSDINTLEALIDDHDAIFLLTDSRESRWLPTLIGAAKKKTVLTAALGFDSYLVMRHGVPMEDGQNPEDRVGCYFCNDVVAPGDSTSDRTLDQQCTVTRPGVSYMAAGHIVEILIDILQHPIRSLAGDNSLLPHSIRYYLGRMNQLVTTSPNFKNCSACSSSVVSSYLADGFDFLLKVFNSPSYLEEVAGLTKLHQESQAMEILELSDSDEDSTS
ncbi:UNVERIFIED_CONTAM: hypothetical protein GTU68_042363 [Idotea baltica]|nr:hypothetical protein [Idotea baltica]